MTRIRRFAMVLLLICTSVVSTANLASASMVYQQNSTANFENPSTLTPQYRISNIEVTIDSENSDILVTKVNFPSNLKPDSFVLGTTAPLLRVKIFKKWSDGQPFDGGYGDVWIDSPTDRYQYQNIQIPARASGLRTIGGSPYESRINLESCNPKTWFDPSGQNLWIKFSISMSCIKLPDKFAILAFVDADQNANYQLDYKFAPAKPMAVDISSISRPRPKDSQIATISQLSNFDLRTTSVAVSASSQRFNLYGEASAGNAIQYNSLTPTICSFTNPSQSTLNLISKGICTIEAFAIGDGTTTESNRARMSFTINPIPMQSQTLSYYQPYNVTEGDPDFEINVSASSGLPVVIRSNDASVCYFKDPVNNPRLVTIVGPGTCDFTVSQEGNDRYYPTSGRAYFDVDAKPAPTATSTPKPKTTTKPIEKILGGTGSAASASTEVKAQEKTDAVAEKAKVAKEITCKNGKNIKRFQLKKCPKGWSKY